MSHFTILHSGNFKIVNIVTQCVELCLQQRYYSRKKIILNTTYKNLGAPQFKELSN